MSGQRPGSALEYLPGKSRDPYAVVGGLILGGIAVGGAVLSYVVTQAIDPRGLYPTRDATLNGMFSNIVDLTFVLAFVCYLVFRPMPAGPLEVSPDGVRFPDHVRSRRVPWSNVHVVGRMLYLVEGWEGMPYRYEMMPEQAVRVRAYLEQARSAPPGQRS